MTPAETSLLRNRAAKAYRIACEAHRLGMSAGGLATLNRIVDVASAETTAIVAGIVSAMESARDPYCTLPEPHVCIRNTGEPIRAGMACYVRTAAELRKAVAP